jgi:hypothetical protein
MLNEAYGIAKTIEQNISLSEIKDLFNSSDFNMGSLFARENFIDDIQEEGEQTIIQHGIVEDMAKETKPEQMMKYQHVPLPMTKQSMSLFLLHNKRNMRLVAFHFRILMTPCRMI